MDIVFSVAIAVGVIFVVGAEIFHIIEAIRMRRSRKRYIAMIENAARNPAKKDNPQNPFRPLPRPAPGRDN